MKKTKRLGAKNKAFLIAKASDAKKGEDILILDMRKVSDVFDYFVIVTATSSRQVKAIADGIIEDLKKKNLRPLHVEGHVQARWLLLDYSDVVAHIFVREEREFYNLERLWGDASTVNLKEKSLKSG